LGSGSNFPIRGCRFGVGLYNLAFLPQARSHDPDHHHERRRHRRAGHRDPSPGGAGLGEILVVAPNGPRSGSGHSVTTNDPMLLESLRDSWYSLSGTPADCSRVALTRIAPDAEWVLSGINRGGNLGADTYISGTVAAAREAAFLGKKAIAVSQYVRPDLPLDWEWTLRQASRVIRQLMKEPLDSSSFWNVNFPHLPPGSQDPKPVYCGLDLCPLDVGFRTGDPIGECGTTLHYTGKYHGRERTAGRDVQVCFGGAIAITRIPLDITG
jgi:5'-nucleotidase